MRKLLILLLLFPFYCFAQDPAPASPFTPVSNVQWYEKILSLDTIPYVKGSDGKWRQMARRKWVLAQITAGSGVPTTRAITTTPPLTGGGNFSADRTFGIAGLTGYGSSNQLVRMNSGATGWEYFTPTYYTLAAFTTGSVIFYNGTTLAQDNPNFFWDSNNHRLGLATTSPTHTLTLGSNASGIAAYNTTDQTTNYERVRITWIGNSLNFYSQKGGTGTVRDFKFAGGQVAITNVQSGTAGTDSLTVISGSVIKKIPANYYSTPTPIVEISGTTQQAAVNTIYIPHNTGLTSITLPVTSVIGSLVQIIGEGGGSGGWKILQNASQVIVGVGVTTTVGTGGSLASTNANCTVTLRLTAPNKFVITTNQGTLTPI